MRTFEYQAKEIFAKYKIPTPKGIVCESPEEAAAAFDAIGSEVVVKAQVMTGGRGKAGGVKFARSRQEAQAAADQILDMRISDLPVSKVLVEERLQIASEYYLSIITDTDGYHGCPLLMIGARGGMEVEEIANQDPNAMRRVHIDPRYGVFPHHVLSNLVQMPIAKKHHNQIEKIARQLYQAYWEMDGELAEINPLVVTADDRVIAADARLYIDSNALFRHPELKPTFTNPFEQRAASARLAYVHLDGNIGIIANGAGLAMGTMDMVRVAGGRPANFLDPGERIMHPGGLEAAFGIILDNPNVEAVLFNVFGGGVRCDRIATRLVEVLSGLPNFNLPMVLCLRGRNEEEGQRTIAAFGCKSIEMANSMEEAVERVVKLVKLGGK
ncbi:MAG: ADP-forming succinate--CoA ligase subunit beta [Dehalococcoidales bacterium]|nr:ADP-forming succinate--CoA ligase subunit beta [Dehalococcoidales bacterium]